MDCAALRYTGTHYYIYARERVCVRTPIAKGKGCLGWCVEMERGFGVFGDSRRWECWYIALFARGSVV